MWKFTLPNKNKCKVKEDEQIQTPISSVSRIATNRAIRTPRESLAVSLTAGRAQLLCRQFGLSNKSYHSLPLCRSPSMCSVSSETASRHDRFLSALARVSGRRCVRESAQTKQQNKTTNKSPSASVSIKNTCV